MFHHFLYSAYYNISSRKYNVISLLVEIVKMLHNSFLHNLHGHLVDIKFSSFSMTVEYFTITLTLSTVFTLFLCLEPLHVIVRSIRTSKFIGEPRTIRTVITTWADVSRCSLSSCINQYSINE